MVTECSSGHLDLALPKRGGDLVPYFLVRLDQRTRVDCPAVKSEGRLGADETGGLQLLGPQAVMRSDDELRLGKVGLQQFAELITMSGIDGHDHVVRART